MLKSHLNHETLPRVIAKRPKILVINCNGGIDFENKSTNLWFEDTEKPSVVDTFSESRLKVPFQPNKENNLLTSVQLASCCRILLHRRSRSKGFDRSLYKLCIFGTRAR